MRDFKKIIAWQKAHKFVLEIYSLAKEFSNNDIDGIAKQLRKASVSIPSNISEGCGRNSKRELYDFLEIAMAATSEVEYLMLLSKDIEILNEEKYDKINSELIEVREVLKIYMQEIDEDINSTNSNKF